MNHTAVIIMTILLMIIDIMYFTYAVNDIQGSQSSYVKEDRVLKNLYILL